MKTVDAGQFAENLDQFLQDSCALVHGLDYDEEDLQLISSKEFWSMLREARQSPTIPLEVAEKRLLENGN
jgi:hypothetical protein